LKSNGCFPYYVVQLIHVILASYATDIDECSVSSPCSTNATCSNTNGSFICSCDSGYSGDGLTCDGIIYIYSINILAVVF